MPNAILVKVAGRLSMVVMLDDDEKLEIIRPPDGMPGPATLLAEVFIDDDSWAVDVYGGIEPREEDGP